MKRYLPLIALLCIYFNLLAENTLTVTPFKISQKGQAVKDATDELSIYLTCNRQFAGTSFFLYAPNEILLSKAVKYRTIGEDILPFNEDEECPFSIEMNTCARTREGYTVWSIQVFSTDKIYNTFNAKNGIMFSLKCGSASSADDGIYPIFLDTKLAWGSEPSEAVPFTVTTSYVVIGNPQDASLSVEGVLPSNVVASLNAETAITSLDLTKCTQINGTLDLKDGRDLIIDSNVPATKATYTRPGNSYQWGTLCVPFSFSTEGDVKYYTLKEVEGDKMVFTSIEEATIAAGTPVIFKRAKNTPLSIASEENINLTNPVEGATANGLKTKGSFVKTTAAGYYIAQDQFWPGDNFQVPAFRSYFEGSPSQAPFRIVVDDEAAGITELEMDEKGNLHEVYNLQGQHIAAPINGQVNIIDGKKAIMK